MAELKTYLIFRLANRSTSPVLLAVCLFTAGLRRHLRKRLKRVHQFGWLTT